MTLSQLLSKYEATIPTIRLTVYRVCLNGDFLKVW